MKNRMLQLALVPLLSLAGVYIIEAKSSIPQPQNSSSAMQQPIPTSLSVQSVKETAQHVREKVNESGAPILIPGSCSSTVKCQPGKICYSKTCNGVAYHYCGSQKNPQQPPVCPSSPSQSKSISSTAQEKAKDAKYAYDMKKNPEPETPTSETLPSSGSCSTVTCPTGEKCYSLTCYGTPYHYCSPAEIYPTCPPLEQ